MLDYKFAKNRAKSLPSGLSDLMKAVCKPGKLGKATFPTQGENTIGKQLYAATESWQTHVMDGVYMRLAWGFQSLP